jgi:hypothetical protein
MYGLKQAGLLANQLLHTSLALFGYYPARHNWDSDCINVNTSGKAGAQIPHLPLEDDSSPRGR